MSSSILPSGTARRLAMAAVPALALIATTVVVSTDSDAVPVEAASPRAIETAPAPDGVAVEAAGLGIEPATAPAEPLAGFADVRFAASAPAVLVHEPFVDAEGSPIVPPPPVPAPQAVPKPDPRPEPEPEDDGGASGSVWDALAQCESGGNWSISTGTFEGGVQFHPDTWDAYKDDGMPGAAYEASRGEQIRIAERVLADVGWGAWPACSSKLGLR